MRFTLGYSSPCKHSVFWLLPINLAQIGDLKLLNRLYGEVIIPEAVWHEVVVQGTNQIGADEVQSAVWIQTKRIKNRPLVRSIRQELDAGEAEAIVLAMELDAELLLMDERLGRETAHHLGVRYTGLIGVLIEARHKGIISAVKPLLERLRNVAGFHISEALYQQVLQDEGEV